MMNQNNLHLVSADVLEQTLTESTIEYEVDCGNGVFVAHGNRDGLPIVIVGNPSGGFSAVYFNEEAG